MTEPKTAEQVKRDQELNEKAAKSAHGALDTVKNGTNSELGQLLEIDKLLDQQAGGGGPSPKTVGDRVPPQQQK
jgi:hypothetical protein